MKRLLFIYNLHSGKGLIRNHLADIIDTFNKAGYETVVYSTQERADATRLAKELGASYDLVVCSGGDGTLSEMLDGVMTIDEKDVQRLATFRQAPLTTMRTASAFRHR